MPIIVKIVKEKVGLIFVNVGSKLVKYADIYHFYPIISRNIK